MASTRQDERVSQYTETLNFKYRPIGSFDRLYTKNGWEIKTAPFKAIPKTSIHIENLTRFFHSTGLNFQIYENGEVWLLVPHKQQYGYILGQIAHAYKYAEEAR